jgi:hypothetical protein
MWFSILFGQKRLTNLSNGDEVVAIRQLRELKTCIRVQGILGEEEFTTALTDYLKAH